METIKTAEQIIEEYRDQDNELVDVLYYAIGEDKRTDEQKSAAIHSPARNMPMAISLMLDLTDPKNKQWRELHKSMGGDVMKDVQWLSEIGYASDFQKQILDVINLKNKAKSGEQLTPQEAVRLAKGIMVALLAKTK